MRRWMAVLLAGSVLAGNDRRVRKVAMRGALQRASDWSYSRKGRR